MFSLLPYATQSVSLVVFIEVGLISHGVELGIMRAGRSSAGHGGGHAQDPRREGPSDLCLSKGSTIQC